MKYDKLPCILQRYSFESKVEILFFYSRQLLKIDSINIENKLPFPWELETMLLFSVKAEECQAKSFKGKEAKIFSNIINCIRFHDHPTIVMHAGNIELINFISIAYGATQYDLQSYAIYKYYRYRYIFNYQTPAVDMKNEFFNKFDIDYLSFIEFGFVLNSLIILYDKISPFIVNYIYSKYDYVLKALTISRGNFAELIDKFSNNIDDYLFCIRPSQSYPFIEYRNQIYFPLPHSLVRATTDSLLYRLTDGNNKLKGKIGKYVLEDYLYSIIYESNIYDEVIPEKEYYDGKKLKKTSDIMIRKNNEYLFFECKSMVPYAKTRVFEEEKIVKELERIGDAVIQLYQQIYFDFNSKYNFFVYRETKIELDKKYGIVVLLERSYVMEERIYENVRNKLHLSTDSEEYNWILNHIKIKDLNEVEAFMFTSTDLLDDFRDSDYTINSILTNNNVLTFKQELKQILQTNIDELLKKHLF